MDFFTEPETSFTVIRIQIQLIKYPLRLTVAHIEKEHSTRNNKHIRIIAKLTRWPAALSKLTCKGEPLAILLHTKFRFHQCILSSLLRKTHQKWFSPNFQVLGAPVPIPFPDQDKFGTKQWTHNILYHAIFHNVAPEGWKTTILTKFCTSGLL